MGSKVLLADDSVTIQKVVGIIFANEDYDLTIVATGDDAIRKAGEITPDVMLVDALMPGKNGYEVCREIRQNPALSHVAILLMTGAFEVVDEEKNRLSGADDFIVKPFESQTLIDATNRMIALTAERSGAPAPTPSPAAPQPAPQPVAAAPAAAPSVDDVWASGFDMEPAAEVRQEPAFAAPPVAQAFASPAPVKATADDDLWGAFDMDAFEESAPPVQAPVPTPAPAAPADDFFSFADAPPQPVSPPAEKEFVLEEVAVPAPQPAVVPTATGFEPVGEEEISFGDEAPAPARDIPAAAPSVEDDFSTISFDEPEPAPAVFVPPPLPPVVEYAPPVEPAAPPVQSMPEPVPVAQTAPTAPAASDEAQLRALLSTASREMIEKIVWEVVPDLAEAIIRDEIRKLKAGIA
jgi:CheY-like chemotaxis protein